jgi:hypothetical protein
MIGYPDDIGILSPQVERIRPLFAKGIVAGKNYSTRRIILNTLSFGGNSGGAVWGRQEQGLGSWSVYIMGVVVEWIPGVNKVGENQFILLNSGYAVVEPMDSVLELLP